MSIILHQLSSVKFVMFLRLCFGHYYDCHASRFIRFLAKSYCAIFLLSNVLFSLFGVTYVDIEYQLSLHYYGITVHFMISLVFSLITKQDYFFKYRSAIELIANELGTPITEPNSLIPFCLCIFGFIIDAADFIHDCFTDGWFECIYFFSAEIIYFLSINTGYLPVIIMIEWIYKAFKNLSNALVAKFQIAGINDYDKIECLESYMRLHQRLVNILQSVRKDVNVLVILSHICNCYKVLIFIYLRITVRINMGPAQVVFWILWLITENLITLLPALVMEATANEIDKVKTLLAKEILECVDSQLRLALYDTLDYIEVYGVEFVLWPNYPMNLQTTLGFAGVITSYIISLLQFRY